MDCAKRFSEGLFINVSRSWSCSWLLWYFFKSLRLMHLTLVWYKLCELNVYNIGLMILFNGLRPLYSTRAWSLKFKAWGRCISFQEHDLSTGLRPLYFFSRAWSFSRLEAVVFNKSMTCDYEKDTISGFLSWLEAIELNKSMTSSYRFAILE
jgi:hypothetical protein